MKFQCSRCEATFSDMASFLRHMEEVHGRGPGDTGPRTFEAVDEGGVDEGGGEWKG